MSRNCRTLFLCSLILLAHVSLTNAQQTEIDVPIPANGSVVGVGVGKHHFEPDVVDLVLAPDPESSSDAINWSRVKTTGDHMLIPPGGYDSPAPTNPYEVHGVESNSDIGFVIEGNLRMTGTGNAGGNPEFEVHGVSVDLTFPNLPNEHETNFDSPNAWGHGFSLGPNGETEFTLSVDSNVPGRVYVTLTEGQYAEIRRDENQDWTPATTESKTHWWTYEPGAESRTYHVRTIDGTEGGGPTQSVEAVFRPFKPGTQILAPADQWAKDVVDLVHVPDLYIYSYTHDEYFRDGDTIHLSRRDADDPHFLQARTAPDHLSAAFLGIPTWGGVASNAQGWPSTPSAVLDTTVASATSSGDEATVTFSGGALSVTINVVTVDVFVTTQQDEYNLVQDPSLREQTLTVELRPEGVEYDLEWELAGPQAGICGFSSQTPTEAKVFLDKGKADWATWTDDGSVVLRVTAQGVNAIAEQEYACLKFRRSSSAASGSADISVALPVRESAAVDHGFRLVESGSNTHVEDRITADLSVTRSSAWVSDYQNATSKSGSFEIDYGANLDDLGSGTYEFEGKLRYVGGLEVIAENAVVFYNSGTMGVFAASAAGDSDGAIDLGFVAANPLAIRHGSTLPSISVGINSEGEVEAGGLEVAWYLLTGSAPSDYYNNIGSNAVKSYSPSGAHEPKTHVSWSTDVKVAASVGVEQTRSEWAMGASALGSVRVYGPNPRVTFTPSY